MVQHSALHLEAPMTDYVSKRKPRVKQQEGLDRLIGHADFALQMDMRTGKTKVLLDDFARLHHAGLMDDLLIIAPAGVYLTWAGEIDKDFSDELRRRTLIYTWQSSKSKGARAQAEQEMFMQVRDRPRVLLMNVEALSNVERARSLAQKFLSQKRRVMFAIDESTSIKNWKAQRTKYINRSLAQHAESRRILTGLISPKSPMDLYSQFEFLNPNILGFRSFYAFRARYAEMETLYFGSRRIQKIKGYKNLDELQAKIAPYSYRVRLEDCYDLPPKMYSFRDVDMTPEQAKAYAQIKEHATTQLESGDHVTATAVITQMLRLHQVLCGHVMDENGVLHELPENRTAALIEMLEEYEGKAIIWCSYDYNIQKVAAALKEHFGCKVARFWGGNRATREDEERMFKTDPECPYIVATPAAGGRGRTWDEANLVIYYSNTYDLEHRSQSEERSQAVGKTTSVGYVDLRAPGTVDEKIIHALRNKINLASVVNGENIREWLV